MTARVIPLDPLHARLVRLYRSNPQEAYRVALAFWSGQGLTGGQLAAAVNRSAEAALEVAEAQKPRIEAALGYLARHFATELDQWSDLCVAREITVEECADQLSFLWRTVRQLGIEARVEAEMREPPADHETVD